MNNSDFPEIDRIEQKNLENTFQTGQLHQLLGITRDTLRYYEDVGILSPRKDEGNQYRKYGFADFFTLMGIEFYKKRGMSVSDIRQILNGLEPGDLPALLSDKEWELEQEITQLQRTHAKLRAAREFCETLEQTQNQFSIREHGLYEIISTFPALSALEEYPDKVLRHINPHEDDLLSNIVRVLTFDDRGYRETKACLVRESTGPAAEGSRYLATGPCIYTVVESGSSKGDPFLMETTRLACAEWARKQGCVMTGTAYLKMRLILMDGSKERIFVEAWVPVEKL